MPKNVQVQPAVSPVYEVACTWYKVHDVHVAKEFDFHMRTVLNGNTVCRRSPRCPNSIAIAIDCRSKCPHLTRKAYSGC